MRMPFFNYWKEHFGIKVVLKFAFFICVIILSFTAFLIFSQNKILTENLLKNGKLLAAILADNSRIGVFSENPEMLSDPAGGIFHRIGVLGVSVFNLEGELLKKLEKPGTRTEEEQVKAGVKRKTQVFERLRNTKSGFYLEDDNRFEFWSPVFAGSGSSEEELLILQGSSFQEDKQTIGFVKVVLDKKILDEQQTRLFYRSMTLGLVFLLIGSGATCFVVKEITKPLNRLT